MKKYLLSFFILITIGSSVSIAGGYEKFYEVLESMRTNIYVKGATFDFVKIERVNGKMISSTQSVKYQAKPKKIYMKITAGPDAGTELLFVPTENDGKVRVSAGRWVPTLSLSPFSSLLAKNQRNTLYELGFAYTGKVLYKSFTKYKSKAKEFYDAGWASYEGLVKVNGRVCHKLLSENKEYKLIDYKVVEGDILRKIAKKMVVDAYSIVEVNDNIDDNGDLKPGMVIKVPNSYAKKVEVYVDTINKLPVKQKMWDNSGLVAEYQYTNIKINPTFAADEFTEDFDEYGF